MSVQKYPAYAMVEIRGYVFNEIDNWTPSRLIQKTMPILLLAKSC